MEQVNIAETRDLQLTMFDKNTSEFRGLDLTQFGRNISYTKFELLFLKQLQKYYKLPEFVLFGLPAATFSFGVFVNSLLIVYLIKSRKYRISVYAVLMSIAISDLITCLTLSMTGLIFPEIRFVEVTILCKLIMYFIGVGYFSSLYHVIFLSALRYYQLIYPLAAKSRVTLSWVRKMCVLIWLVTWIGTLPRLFFNAPHRFRFEGRLISVCVFQGNIRTRVLVYFVLFYSLPTFVVCTLHILKTIAVSRGAKRLTTREGRSTSSRVVGVIIALFFITIIPICCHNAYHYIFNYPQKEIHFILYLLLSQISYLNAILNPFVYLLCSGEIRKHIKKILWAEHG